MRVTGNGVDIIETERIERLIDKTAFLNKCFTPSENSYINSFAIRSERAAGIFCAKEAFLKAIGTGIGAFSLHELSVTHTDMGKPYFEFSGKLLNYVNENRLTFFLSISHSKTVATAYVIAVTED